VTAGLSLAVEGIRKSYRRTGFSLEVERLEVPAGSSLALLGPSGSGKSTLLTIMALLDRPDAGRVLVDGRPCTPKDRDVRLRMAAVFQRPYLFKGSVESNVGYGLVARGVRSAERRRRISETLERVGLAGFERRSALSLSGGEAQRVSFARALVLDPQILLLDEPLASLDLLLRRRLIDDLTRILSSSSMTVVYVTHDHDEALAIAGRIAIMNRGRIAAFGPSDEVMSLATDQWTAAFLGIEETARGRVASVTDGLIAIDLDNGPTVFAVGHAPVGARVEVAVRPEDVPLFEAGVELPANTIRNRIPATVKSIRARGAANHVVLDASGLLLAAAVTRASTAELGLVPGSKALAVFKASAVRWRRLKEPASS
jgi:molybdopterin-binding protein